MIVAVSAGPGSVSADNMAKARMIPLYKQLAPVVDYN
jgi:hypothetical protein